MPHINRKKQPRPVARIAQNLSERGSDGTRSVAPDKLELLITVVERKKAGYYVDLIQSFNVNLQVTALARGTADQKLLQYLGLSDTDKIAIFSIVREDKVDEIMAQLDEKFKSIRDGKGVSLTVPIASMIGALLYGFLSDNRIMAKGE